MNETVKIRVEIDIRSEGTHDTGLTVDEWNALTDDTRGVIAQKMWDTEAEGNQGGIWVQNCGATSL